MAQQEHTLTASSKSDSLEDLYSLYSGDVFHYLMGMTWDSDLAEDLTSETFYRAILAIDGFRWESTIKTWLLRIARNLYLRHIERGKKVTSLEEIEESAQETSDFRARPEELVILKEQQDAVKRALMMIQESDRSILLLRAQAEMTHRDIGEVLGITEGSVKVRIHRARRRLAEALRNIEGATEPSTSRDHVEEKSNG
jgi:RNA polymerase sigma-70 factor (ECF subfamily)